MENKKNNIFLLFFVSNRNFFVSNCEKNILFGIGNGAQFRGQILAPKSGDLEPWPYHECCSL